VKQVTDSAPQSLPIRTTSIRTDGLVLGAVGEWLLFAASLVLSIGIIVLMALSPDPSPFLLTNTPTYLLLVIALVTAWFTHRHQTRISTQMFLWGIFVVMFWNAWLVQGVRTPGLLVSLPMLILLSGWLIGLRQGLVFGAIGIASTLLLWGAEHFKLMDASLSRPTTNYAMVLIMGQLVTMAVAYGSLSGFMQQMAQITDLTASLQRRVVDVERSEARFAALFRDTPLPCATVDLAGVIVDANHAWLQSFGYTHEQVVGHTAIELGLWVHPEQRDVFYAEYFRHGTVSGFPANLQSPNMPSRPFLLFASEVSYAQERGFIISLLDQSDRVAAEEAQRMARTELEQRVTERTMELQQTVTQLTQAHEGLVRSEKLASLGALVAGVSHELNTPLGNSLTVATSLQHNVARMRDAVEHNQVKRSELLEFFRQHDEMADVITRNTQRAAYLVSSFKQVAVDRTSERKREFQLHALVDDILLSMRPSTKHLQLDIAIDISTEITCYSYPGAIGQIMSNLLQNCAVHAFAKRGGGSIHIRAQTDGPWVQLSVQDDGEGMTAQVLGHVFDPFFTTRLGQGGSGLGLSVSHTLAESVLGGSLSASSEPGKGSCFTLRFLRNVPDTTQDLA
jgi:PAS domain S-box-containing protein